MLWIQALPAFCIWLVYVFLMRNWVQAGRNRYQRYARPKRVAMALGSAVAALAVIAVGFLLLSNEALAAEGRLTLFGTLVVAAFGLAFIHLQMLSFSVTLSLAFDGETAGASPASDSSKAGERQGENSK